VGDANANCSPDSKNTAHNSPKHAISSEKIFFFILGRGDSPSPDLCPVDSTRRPGPSLLDLPVRPPRIPSRWSIRQCVCARLNVWQEGLKLLPEQQESRCLRKPPRDAMHLHRKLAPIFGSAVNKKNTKTIGSHWKLSKNYRRTYACRHRASRTPVPEFTKFGE